MYRPVAIPALDATAAGLILLGPKTKLQVLVVEIRYCLEALRAVVLVLPHYLRLSMAPQCPVARALRAVLPLLMHLRSPVWPYLPHRIPSQCQSPTYSGADPAPLQQKLRPPASEIVSAVVAVLHSHLVELVLQAQTHPLH